MTFSKIGVFRSVDVVVKSELKSWKQSADYENEWLVSCGTYDF